MRKFKDLSRTQKILRVIILTILVSLIIAVCVWFCISHLLSTPEYCPDIVIPSPDGRYELVAREWGYFHSAYTDIFSRKPGQDKWYNSWMEKDIGCLQPINYSHPISDGDYYVKWESDTVTLYYYVGWPEEKKDTPSTWRGILTYEFE